MFRVSLPPFEGRTTKVGDTLRKPFLIDGPLMTTIERRKATIERMAKDLIRLGAPLGSDREAVRALLAHGYSTVDVAILAEEARMVAFQDVVAREMSER